MCYLWSCQDCGETFESDVEVDDAAFVCKACWNEEQEKLKMDRAIEVLEAEVETLKADVEKYKEFGNVVWEDLVETQAKYAQLRLYTLAALESADDEGLGAHHGLMAAMIRMLERGLGMREPSPLVEMLKAQNLPFRDQGGK